VSWSWPRVLLIFGLGMVGLVLVGGAMLLKVAELFYQSMKSEQGANERAVVSDLRALLAAQRPGQPPRPPAAAEASGEAHSSGRSSFCADASGLVRFSLEGEDPPFADGTCPASWLILSDGAPAPAW